jgi:diketogulonate reductase-like aldo/keto reductase
VQFTRRKSLQHCAPDDDAFIDNLAQRGIAYVPFFPLGGFNSFQSATLDGVADSLGATPTQVAPAWLLLRSPNILLIPRTSSATPAGESPSRNIDVAIGHAHHTRGPWHEVRTKT